MIPLYPRFDRYDLKEAGTDTLPFLSNLFSNVDKNIIHISLNWVFMGYYGFYKQPSIVIFNAISERNFYFFLNFVRWPDRL